MGASILTLLTLVIAAAANKLNNEPQNNIVLDLLSTLPEDFEDRGWVSRCPHIEGLTVEKTFWDNLEFCFTRNYGDELLNREMTAANTTEDFQAILNKYCNILPTIHQCFDNLTSISEACLTKAQHALFVVNEENFKLASNILCHEHGRRFGRILGERNHIRKNEVSSCAKAVGDKLNPLSISVDTSTQYRAVKSFRECIVSLQQGEDVALGIGEEVLTEFLRGMHCTGQQPGTTRLCEGLDTVA